MQKLRLLPLSDTPKDVPRGTPGCAVLSERDVGGGVKAQVQVANHLQGEEEEGGEGEESERRGEGEGEERLGRGGQYA